MDPMRWIEPSGADDVRRDVITLIRFAVTADLRFKTRKELLSQYVLSLLTKGTSNGPFGTQYYSAGALDPARDLTDPQQRLEHEHVYTRAWWVEKLLVERWDIEAMVAFFAIACTVTRAEHRLLDEVDRSSKNTLVGWERYHAAGIVVTDLATGVTHLDGMAGTAVRATSDGRFERLEPRRS